MNNKIAQMITFLACMGCIAVMGMLYGPIAVVLGIAEFIGAGTFTLAAYRAMSRRGNSYDS